MSTKLKLISALALNFSITLYAFADTSNNCFIELAVAEKNSRLFVAFNASDSYGFSRSITLLESSGPAKMESIPCSPNVINITATPYSQSEISMSTKTIGSCVLKSGGVVLNSPGSSVSVVFPYDFNCG